MDRIYFDISELNTKWVKILGYTLCSRAAKSLEKVWQHALCCFHMLLPLSHFFLSCCLEHVLDFRYIVRNNSQWLEGRSYFLFPSKIRNPLRYSVQQIWTNTAKCTLCSQPHWGRLFSVSSDSSFWLVWETYRGIWRWQGQLRNLKSSVQNENVGPLFG